MNTLECIGNTPLFSLTKIMPAELLERNIRILAKGEYLNASGSVKDRAAKKMVLRGIKEGKLGEGKTLIDSTSGNTGIAYAMLGASLGFGVELFMPANVTSERKKMMRAYGAKITETPVLDGMEGAYKSCMETYSKNRDSYFYPDQFTNEANWMAHYEETGEEIWKQTNGSVTHFVAGTGTGGTFIGCSRKLKEHSKKINCITVTPDLEFHGIEGIKHFSKMNKNGFFNEAEADGKITVTTEEAYKMTRRLTKEEGIFVGISSGANVFAATRIAQDAPDGSVIVTVLCDNGCRYLSSPLWAGR